MIRAFRGVMPTIASNAFVDETAVIIGDVVIGSESSVWFNAVIRGDVNHIRIGHRTNIQDLSLLHITHDTHPLILGDDITIGHHVVLHGCSIHDRVLIGMGSIVMDGVDIEENCIVGAGSLVTERTHVPANSLILGSPARVIRSLSDEELAWIKESAQHYINYASQYMEDQQEG